MSYKKYMLFRLLGVIIIAAVAGWAGGSHNIIWLIPAVIVVGAALIAMKRRVNEVVVDERVNSVAYRASRVAYLVFVALAVLAGVTLVNLAEDASDAIFHIGLTLEYSACALILFYWVAFTYYNRKFGGKG